MKAVILAAGIGKRLRGGADQPPKALLSFGGKTLLARHLDILRRCGVEQAVIATGYKAPDIEAELARLGALQSGFASCVLNPDFGAGSILSLWTVRETFAGGDDILLMDADVLYDFRLLSRLTASAHQNCFLMDRNIEPGEEPVKLCVKGGRPVDFHKTVGGSYDYYGESVGFFRFAPEMARRLAQTAEGYVASRRTGEWYEEAVRDLLLAHPADFGFEDVTGLPWIEIDFPEDVVKAREDVLPRLAEPEGSPE